MLIVLIVFLARGDYKGVHFARCIKRVERVCRVPSKSLSSLGYIMIGTGEYNIEGNPAMDLHLIQRVVEKHLVTSCHRNRDKRWPDWPLGSYADFTSTSELLLAPFQM